MAAYTTPRVETLKAGGTINQYNIVKFDSADDQVIECTADTDAMIGIAMGDAVSGGFVEVAKAGGGAKVKLGGTVARGAFVTSSGAGLGLAAASGDVYIARAMASGVSGDVIPVEVCYGSLA